MTQSRTTNRLVVRGLIKSLALGAGMGMVIVAPNTTELIDKIMKKIDKKNAAKTLSYLKYRKLVEVKKKGSHYQYRLTAKGWDAYQRIEISELVIPTPKKWDHKWRLVMFDIPQDCQKQRQYFLHQLRLLNFYMLQQSAWIHPFDCEKQIGVLLTYLKLEPYVSYMVVDKDNFTQHATDHFKKVKLLV